MSTLCNQRRDIIKKLNHKQTQTPPILYSSQTELEYNQGSRSQIPQLYLIISIILLLVIIINMTVQHYIMTQKINNLERVHQAAMQHMVKQLKILKRGQDAGYHVLLALDDKQIKSDYQNDNAESTVSMNQHKYKSHKSSFIHFQSIVCDLN